jgi:putative transposase
VLADLRDEWRELGGRVLGTSDVTATLGWLREDPALRFASSAEIVEVVGNALARAEAVRRRCATSGSGVCTDFGADLREFNGEEDHVHLLVHYPPAVAISRLVNSLKGVSSRRLRSAYVARTNQATTHGHLWSPSYFAGSCGGAPLAVVKDYIAQQKRTD